MELGLELNWLLSNLDPSSDQVDPRYDMVGWELPQHCMQFYMYVQINWSCWRGHAEIMTTFKRTALDGGYGWMVVLGSFICHLIQYGLSWTVGIFHVIFLEEIGGSKESVALVSSLNMAFFFFAGNWKTLMFLVMICALRVIAQNITETDEIKNIKICRTKHECSTKHQPINVNVQNKTIIYNICNNKIN